MSGKEGNNEGPEMFWHLNQLFCGRIYLIPPLCPGRSFDGGDSTYLMSQKTADDKPGASKPARCRRPGPTHTHFKRRCDTKETKLTASSLALSTIGWSMFLFLGIKKIKLCKQACYSKAAMLYLNWISMWYSSSKQLYKSLQSARL